MRDLPDLLRAGDALVVNDTRVIPARLTGRRIGRGAEAEHRGDADQAARRLALERLRARPAKKLAAGDIIRFGEEGKVCFLGQLDATVEAKGEGGEVTLSFAFHGPVLDQAIAERGDMPLPPYIAGKRAPDDAGPRRLPDPVRARRRLGRGADRGPAFHRRSAGARSQARGVALHTVTLHVGPGTFLPVHADDTAEHKMHSEHAVLSAETADGAERRARQRRADRGGRLDRAAHARKRRGRRRHAPAVFRRDRDLHHAGLPLQGGRRDADQLPPAALDAVHAGVGVLRARHDAARLCACDREGYRFYSYGDACLLFRYSGDARPSHQLRWTWPGRTGAG